MFGFSFSKILLTVVAIALVWYGWKWINRVQARSRGELDESGRRPIQRKRRARRAAPEDLVQCTICGSYVPAEGGAPCDRPDCPFPI